MNRRSIFTGALAALVASLGLSAKEMPVPTMSVLLYPEGQNSNVGIVENGVAVTLGPLESNGLTGEITVNEFGEYYNVGNQARLDIYLPEKCNGQMLVDCPGGGYAFTAMINEGLNVADWCLENDIACCVVSYRMPNGHAMIPLTDVQNAFRYCRAHASEWGVRQIGVIGFSAGGHLAASASTLFTDKITRPDFSVLIYPVISLDGKYGEATTRGCLLGDKFDDATLREWSLQNHVGEDTPDAIIFLSDNDSCVNPMNCVLYYEKMKEFGHSCELHIFRSGEHGWGFTTYENSGRDGLGRQRPEMFTTLSRWLADIRTE